MSASVFEEDSQCYTLFDAPVTQTCQAPYVLFAGEFGGITCRHSNPDYSDPQLAGLYDCPDAPTGAFVIRFVRLERNGIEFCYYPTGAVYTCPTGTTLEADGISCRGPFDLVPGALKCATGFVLIDNTCLQFVDAIVEPSSGPTCSDQAANCATPIPYAGQFTVVPHTPVGTDGRGALNVVVAPPAAAASLAADVDAPLAHTGSESAVLGYAGVGLIAFGAVVLSTRRKFFSGTAD